MRKNRSVVSSGFVALGCVGFIASAPAMAEEADEQGERIVVTGELQKATSSAKDTAPIANTPRIVNVISEETLENTASFSCTRKIESTRSAPVIVLVT